MPPLAELLGESPAILEVRDTVRRLLQRGAGAPRTPPLLISGETGTGKGLLARAIHRAGARATGPLVDVNCAAIPDTLLEAELFGFERGAFTDARQAKPGLFQAASGGTLFLDEIGLLPATLQGKLLTVIEEQTVRRLGSTRAEPIDVAVIAATSDDLVQAVRAQRFREDLYHRLGVLTLRLPALRERDGDVLLLADHFLARACAEYGVAPKTLAPEARAALRRHSWPGNVRELVNLMERVVLLSDGPLITADALGLAPVSSPAPAAPARPEAPPLPDALQALERDRCLAALQLANWNLSRAAATLGIPRNTLRYRIEKYRLGSDRAASRVPPVPAPAEAETLAAATTTATASGARPRPHLQWQRRHVAFLRAVIGPLPGAELPADAHGWLAALADKARSFGGRVDEQGRHGLLATFGVESAEDAARRAAHAALAMARAAARAAEVGPARGRLTIAIHVDHALVAETGGEVLDADAKLAAWSLLETLVARGRPDAIVVSTAAAPFLERGFDLERVGAEGAEPPLHELRGLEGTGYGLGGRPLSPFVGRGGELALLAERLAAAEAGSGHAVGIMGEPGVGKSRLIYECVRAARGRGHRIVQSRGVSHGTATPYGPIVELLRAFFDITDRDVAADIRAKVLRTLTPQAEAFATAGPPLLSLLDVPVDEPAWHALQPPQRRERVQQAIEHLLLREARTRPLLLVVEDLQWIDSETQAVLDRLVARVAATPLLLLVSYRPEYEHGWASKAACTQLRLDPLSRRSSSELLRTMLGDGPGLSPLRELLIERTGGNPFFLEESVRGLVETGMLVGERGARVVTTDPDDIQVPPSVHAVLAARIRRLPAAGRAVLPAAAVAGRTVPLALLRRIVDEPAGTLERGLAELRAAEFLYETGLPGEPEYSFKHALTHEVAYGSVLADTRRELHRRIVDTLETLQPDGVGERAETLAHHALRGELWDAAGRHLHQAGVRATARSAYREAVGFFEQALAALARLPQTEPVASEALDVRIALGPALIATRGAGSPDVDASYRAAQELCHRLGETRRLFPILWARWYVAHNRAQYEEAARLGEQLLSVAAGAGDQALLLEAHHSTWSTLFAMGRPLEADAHCRKGIALYDPSLHHSSVLQYGGHDPGACARGIRSYVLWELGFPDQAREQSEDTLRLATRLAHPMTTAITLYGAARLHHNLGDIAAATQCAEKAVALGRAHGIAVWADQASMLLGRLLVQSGRPDEGLQRLHAARPGATAHGWTWGAVLSAAFFAAACLDLGHLDEGLEMLDAVDARKTEGFYEPELKRLRGKLLLARTPAAADEAAACFRRAIDVARRRHARSLELRAAMSLARLQRRRGEHEAARRTLAEIYDWFTEGHDTADLQEARRLLDALT